MIIKNIYPSIPKKRQIDERLRRLIGILLLIGSIVCIFLNLLLKGKPWSLIVSFSSYMAWNLIFSPTLVERNRIETFIKFLTQSCLLLHFIDLFLVRGWGLFVIPIVLFSGLIFASILLFTDYETQKENIFPVYLLLLFSLILSLFGVHSDYVTKKWVYIVLFGVSLFYMFVCTFIVNNNIIKEFKKRLSIK